MKMTFQYYQPFAPSIILSSSYVPRQPPIFYSFPSLFVSCLIHVDLFLFFISISSVTVSIDLCAFLSLSSILFFPCFTSVRHSHYTFFALRLLAKRFLLHSFFIKKTLSPIVICRFISFSLGFINIILCSKYAWTSSSSSSSLMIFSRDLPLNIIFVLFLFNFNPTLKFPYLGHLVFCNS